MLDKSRIILFRLFYLKEDTAAWFVRSPMMTCNRHPQNGYIISGEHPDQLQQFHGSRWG